MKSSTRANVSIGLILASATSGFSFTASAAGPYTPDQVYFVMHQAVREAFGIQNDQNPGGMWLSLSTVGSVVDPGDPGQVNDLADFCPPAKPVMDAFTRVPKLDSIYDHVVNGLVSPQKDFTPAYAKAKGVLFDGTNKTAEYKAYLDREKAYIAAYRKLYEAKTSIDRTEASKEMQNAQIDWTVSGFKNEINKALDKIKTEEYATGFTRQMRRRDVLDSYRALGVAGTDAILGAFVSPFSQLSPEPSKWGGSSGWVSVSSDDKTIEKRYEKEASQGRGFGSLSLGFLNVVGSGSNSGSYERRVENVYQLVYSFDVMRVSIKRPWLDAEVFFQPYDWTWRKTTTTVEYPFVSIGRDPTTGGLRDPDATIYDNKQISCGLMPLEAVVARNRKITATVSKSNYEKIEQSGSASGGGSLFGIFGGGGSRNWNRVKITEDANTVTFSVTADGIAVIGMISQVLPKAPNPNLNDRWSKDAWLPPDLLPTAFR